MKTVDLHTHILPGIDDGARTMEESLEMLRNAAACDVEALVATPHSNIPGVWENHCDSAFMDRLRRLRRAAEEAAIPVKVLAGMEVRANEGLCPLLQQGKLLTLNGSRYLLTEFAGGDTPQRCEQLLGDILALGYVPLIAHPERYSFLWQRPYVVERWLNMGCHVQLTAGSILGKFGRNAKLCADALLRADLVACVASDAHGANRRTNYLGDVTSYLSVHYAPGYAKMLLWDNPLRICQNQSL